jgi:hypothetical protein
MGVTRSTSEHAMEEEARDRQPNPRQPGRTSKHDDDLGLAWKESKRGFSRIWEPFGCPDALG